MKSFFVYKMVDNRKTQCVVAIVWDVFNLEDAKENFKLALNEIDGISQNVQFLISKEFLNGNNLYKILPAPKGIKRFNRIEDSTCSIKTFNVTAMSFQDFEEMKKYI